MLSVRWWEYPWKVTYSSGFDKEGFGFYETLEVAELVRDILLGVREEPTREEIQRMGKKSFGYARPVGEKVIHAEVKKVDAADRDMLRAMAKQLGEI